MRYSIIALDQSVRSPSSIKGALTFILWQESKNKPLLLFFATVFRDAFPLSDFWEISTPKFSPSNTMQRFSSVTLLSCGLFLPSLFCHHVRTQGEISGVKCSDRAAFIFLYPLSLSPTSCSCSCQGKRFLSQCIGQDFPAKENKWPMIWYLH